MMPVFVQAGLWGLFSASGLTIGALLAVTLYGRLSHRVIAGVMGFGGGVLIAVVAVSLIWMHLSIRQMERPSVSPVAA